MDTCWTYMVEFWGGVTTSSWPYATSVTMTLTLTELQSATFPRSVAMTVKYWSPTWSRPRTDITPVMGSMSNSEEPFPVRRSIEYVTAPLRPESRSVACMIRTTRPMGVSRGIVALYIDWSNVGRYRFVATDNNRHDLIYWRDIHRWSDISRFDSQLILRRYKGIQQPGCHNNTLQRKINSI